MGKIRITEDQLDLDFFHVYAENNRSCEWYAFPLHVDTLEAVFGKEAITKVRKSKNKSALFEIEIHPNE